MMAIDRLRQLTKVMIKTQGPEATIKLQTLLKVIDEEIRTDQLYHLAEIADKTLERSMKTLADLAEHHLKADTRVITAASPDLDTNPEAEENAPEPQ